MFFELSSSQDDRAILKLIFAKDNGHSTMLRERSRPSPAILGSRLHIAGTKLDTLYSLVCVSPWFRRLICQRDPLL